MAETIRCPRCRTEQPPGLKCASCGLDLGETSGQRKAPPRTVRCPYCRTGQPLGPACIKCGLDFREYSRYVKRKKAGEDVSPPKPPIRIKPGRQGTMELEESFRRAWGVFARRWATLLLVSLIAVVVLVTSGVGMAVIVPLAGEEPEALVPLLIGFSLLFILAAFWYMSTLYAAASLDELSLGKAFGRGMRRLPSFLWVMVLHGLIVGGGFFLFIVPGFIFMTWFAFAPFLLFTEDARGMDALLRSREYVRGHGWDVFFKLIVIWIVYMVVGSVPLAGPLLGLPFMLLFIKEMYRDLAGLKGGVETPPGLWPRLRWPMLGLAGCILPAALIVAIALPLSKALRELPQGIQSLEAPPRAEQAETPQLSLGRRSFSPGEEVLVNFSVPEGFSAYAWAGIVPSMLPHGDEEKNRSATSVFRFLDKKTKGTLSFNAPETPGAYDIRLHSMEGGEEVAFVSFIVGPGASSETVSLRAADDRPLEVTVRITSTGCTGAVTANGTLLQEIKDSAGRESAFTVNTVLIGGENTFSVSCMPSDGTDAPVMRISVSTSSGRKARIANWYVYGPSAEKTFRIIVEGSGLRARGLPYTLAI